MAERLTNRTHDGHAYLVNVKDDEQEVECKSENTAQCILDSWERLAAYEDLGTAEEFAALKERTRWVPVSERLPEDVGSYLTYYHEWSNGDFLPKYDDYRIRVMRFMNNGKWCMPACTDKRCEADTNREVTHWMPLPLAPKGE